MSLQNAKRKALASLLFIAGFPTLLAAQSPYSQPTHPAYPPPAPIAYNAPPTYYGAPLAAIPATTEPVYQATQTLPNQPSYPGLIPPGVGAPSMGTPVAPFPDQAIARPISMQTGYGPQMPMPSVLVENSGCEVVAFPETLSCAPGAEPCDLNVCSEPSNTGFFASLEGLVFFANAPRTATFGDEASERMVNVGGVNFMFENSLDTSWMSNSDASGLRLEFGNMIEDCGWYASLWNVKQSQAHVADGVNFAPSDPFMLMSGFSDANADGIDDDIDMDNIYGRSGIDLGTFDNGPPPGFILPLDGQPDQGAPVDQGDLVTWLQTFNNVVSSNTLRMTSGEVNRYHRMPGHNWSQQIAYYYGVRYMQITDTYTVTANGNFLDQSFWQAESQNRLFGPQVGARWLHRGRVIGLSVDGRFFAAYNRQENDLRGYTASLFVADGAANKPVALTANSFVDAFGNDAFSPTGEVRFDAILNPGRYWAMKVGYTFIVAGDISRSSPKIVYALPSSSLRDVESDSTLISHGLSFGIEINR